MAKDKKDKKDKKNKDKQSGKVELVRGERNAVMLTEVRVSYPKLFSLPMRDDNGRQVEGKAGCNLLFAKDDDRQMALMTAVMDEVERVSKDSHDQLPPPQFLCLKDGNSLTTPDPENWVLSTYAASGVLPQVYAPNKAPIKTLADWTAIGGHAGCYVNASVRFWAQKNKHGKRVNCELLGLQFVREGVVLDNSVSASAVEGMFEEIEDGEII